MLADIIRDLGHIRIIEGGVDLVQDEEGRRLVAVDGEEEGEGGHGFLAAGEVLHVAEALERGHGVVFDAVEVGLVGVFDVEVAAGRGKSVSGSGGRGGRVRLTLGRPWGGRRCG